MTRSILLWLAVFSQSAPAVVGRLIAWQMDVPGKLGRAVGNCPAATRIGASSSGCTLASGGLSTVSGTPTSTHETTAPSTASTSVSRTCSAPHARVDWITDKTPGMHAQGVFEGTCLDDKAQREEADHCRCDHWTCSGWFGVAEAYAWRAHLASRARGGLAGSCGGWCGNHQRRPNGVTGLRSWALTGC